MTNKAGVQKENQSLSQGELKGDNDNYLFFSSIELMEYFLNNVSEKDLKTQTKRIFEMARVYMAKKDFEIEDVYSVFIMMKDISQVETVNEVFKLYFKKGKYPTRVVVQSAEMEETADIEIEFSAYRGKKEYIIDEQIEQLSGPVSAAVKADSFVYCSGVGPENFTESDKMDFKDRVKQCMDKLQKTLSEAGSDFKRTYSFMIYLQDENKIKDIEEVFEQYIGKDEEKANQLMKVEKMSNDCDVLICCSAYQ
ncbi:Endoribonuclease L-PSP [Syntrophobotulus glycolicus DSM 8271]|uniref:Endoribonuclease L-PSP n=1 Tax=Syntrophobotulus glycolicus (strain DSM 8271 / FlGlyR) TaxID=645991 RepID=F0SWU4_SYNGF|nr:Rid family hydrolase [Syntrophobotulus glycolicus]ADY54634.1 Endoribonuclease L-PSP [Syntrophobotulus glycolicus DSM 8271]